MRHTQGEELFRQSRRRFFNYVAGGVSAAAVSALSGRSSDAYTAGASYVFAAILLAITASLVPWLLWPDSLRLTAEGITWTSNARRKIVFSARWSDLDSVGLYKPRPVSAGFGISQDRPVQIGFRFKEGRLPADLKARGAGDINFGEWSWTIPNLWNAAPDEIVAACEKHLPRHGA